MTNSFKIYCQRKVRLWKSDQKYDFEIENGIARVFLPFTVFAIIICATYTIAVLLFWSKQRLIDQAIKPSILLDFEVIA